MENNTNNEVTLVTTRLVTAINNPPADDPTLDKADLPASYLADEITRLLDGKPRIVKLFALYLAVREATGLDADGEVLTEAEYAATAVAGR
jgi:hypothetical protein